MKRTIGVFCFVAILALFISTAFAQTPEITNGLAYLNSTQNLDGSWGDETSSTEVLPATSSVIETLQILSETSSQNYIDAISWLQNQSLETSDYLARRISSLLSLGTDNDILLSYIDEIRYAWGGHDDYWVNNLDTILAVQALKAINYPDINLISKSIGYLLTTQNTDGGWGFYDGDDSNVYMTALVSMTLQQFSLTVDLATAINKATDYLINQQQADGSWESIYEIALAYIALVGITTDNTVLGNAINYLTSTQLSNGSWNDDPYSTALAIRALYLSENKPPPPVEPTTGIVTGQVIDASTNQPLVNVTVILQSDNTINTVTDETGYFTLSDIPEDSRTLSFDLTGYTSAAFAVDVTAGSIIDIGIIPLPPNPTAGIIKGTVTDADTGLPLEGVTITVAGSYSASMVTGADGSFIITDVTPGNVTLTAEKTGYYSVTGTGEVVAGGILYFNTQLSTQPPPPTATGNLTGKVLDCATYEPIKGVLINIPWVASTTTDEQGIFLIENIAPGTYPVTITATGYLSQSYKVIITEGVTTDMQTIYLSQSHSVTTVKGKVTDTSTGGPIADAEIAIIGTDLSAKTDSYGEYIISGINLLEFNIKASAQGYDSLTYGMSTSDYGVFTVDFALNPSVAINVNIISLITDKQEYPANDPVNIIVTLENTEETDVDVLMIAQIKDQDNKIVEVIYQQAVPALKLNAYSTETVYLQWNTGQNPPDNYNITLSIIDFAKGILLAEDYTSFAITPTVVIENVKLIISPRFINIGATETINLSAYMTNSSNTEAYLTAEYEVKDTIGTIIDNGTINFSINTSESFKVIELSNFTYTFTQSGQYPVKINILSGDTIISEISEAIRVAPSIRIEPGKTLTPTTITPDGDKRIRIDIHLEGVEE